MRRSRAEGPKRKEMSSDAVHSVSEYPAFPFHEVFKRHAFYTEVTTDIWNLGGVWSQLFHCDDGAFTHRCLGNDEGVSIPATFQDLLALYVLLEVLNGINLKINGIDVPFRQFLDRPK